MNRSWLPRELPTRPRGVASISHCPRGLGAGGGRRHAVRAVARVGGQPRAQPLARGQQREVLAPDALAAARLQCPVHSELCEAMVRASVASPPPPTREHPRTHPRSGQPVVVAQVSSCPAAASRPPGTPALATAPTTLIGPQHPAHPLPAPTRHDSALGERPPPSPRNSGPTTTRRAQAWGDPVVAAAAPNYPPPSSLSPPRTSPRSPWPAVLLPSIRPQRANVHCGRSTYPFLWGPRAPRPAPPGRPPPGRPSTSLSRKA
jgi:hypothetical protein